MFNFATNGSLSALNFALLGQKFSGKQQFSDKFSSKIKGKRQLPLPPFSLGHDATDDGWQNINKTN